jgi:flagellar protein FliO/FliZ
MVLLTSSMFENVFHLIVEIVIFAGVIFLTYMTTRFIGGYQKNKSLNQNLEIIETIRVTNNKYIEIIRAGENRFFVIGIGKDEITKIGELTEDEIKSGGDKNSDNNPFKDFMDSFRKKNEK